MGEPEYVPLPASVNLSPNGIRELQDALQASLGAALHKKLIVLPPGTVPEVRDLAGHFVVQIPDPEGGSFLADVHVTTDSGHVMAPDAADRLREALTDCFFPLL